MTIKMRRKKDFSVTIIVGGNGIGDSGSNLDEAV